MGARRAFNLESSVHRPTPDAERQISLVGLHSINICAFTLHQEQKRDHFGAGAINVHRMFDRDSTAPTTRSSGLGWTSAGVPHIQQIHRNLRTNPVDPSSPLQKLTHTITLIYCFMHNILDSTDRCLVLSPLMQIVQFPCAEQA